MHPTRYLVEGTVKGKANRDSADHRCGTPGKQAENESCANRREGVQFAVALDSKGWPPRMHVPVERGAVRRPVKGVRPADGQVTCVPDVREVVIAVHEDAADE